MPDYLTGSLVADGVTSLYAPDDLMLRAIEIALESGVIIYDALFLALADEMGAVFVTADDKLLKALEGTAFSHLARSLQEANSLILRPG